MCDPIRSVRDVPTVRHISILRHLSVLCTTILLPLPIFLPLLLIMAVPAAAQPAELTVERIMQDPDKWIGSWPSMPFWHESGDTLYFRWNPNGIYPTDSLFRITTAARDPLKVSAEERRQLGPIFDGWRHGEFVYDGHFQNKVYERDGEIWIYHRPTGRKTRLTRTRERESEPRFTPGAMGIIFRRDDNLYRIDRNAIHVQLTDLRSGEDPDKEEERDDQDRLLAEQQQALFEFLRREKAKREEREAQEKRDEAAQSWPPTFYVGSKSVEQLTIDPNERFVTFFLTERQSDDKGTEVPTYVTESGYVETLPARAKVGYPPMSQEFYLQDVERDTTFRVDLRSILAGADTSAASSGRADAADPLSGAEPRPDSARALYAYGPHRSRDGAHAVMDVRTWDNKDRWIVAFDPHERTFDVLDHQHDEAWLQAPGISSQGGRSHVGWLSDGRTFFFQSEATGRSHLYTVHLDTREVTQLTSGDFDVYDPMVSRDGSSWYFTSTEHSVFERHFYRMPIEGGERTRITTLPGRNETALNPREHMLGLRHSYTNRPPEVYLQRIVGANGEAAGDGRTSDAGAASAGGEVVQATESTMSHWEAYPWREGEIVTFEASDGVEVPAQIFEPAQPNGAAVLFVHGAGYLQNVHRWWSRYFREYMFHNLLVDEGYVVMNVDYRGSSGYGRDWRTAVYRHMGGRDLQDFVDASRHLQRTRGIDPERVFIYGGSYGGFITLMALFTAPEHFGGGAALRSVTDWAHYHHGYTANILNTPMEDSLAFARSSPIYFAEGLEDPLLIAHGMIDSNVQFQDVVRLAQRLIELGKEDWEMAVYPLEGHGFEEPESWADEYRRVLKYIRLSVGPREAALDAVPFLRGDRPRERR